MSILLIALALPLMSQNVALTKAKPVRMVRAEFGYRLFSKAYVENEIEKWQKKDVNESNLRYRNRVTETKRREMLIILEEEAKVLERYPMKKGLDHPATEELHKIIR